MQRVRRQLLTGLAAHSPLTGQVAQETNLFSTAQARHYHARDLPTYAKTAASAVSACKIRHALVPSQLNHIPHLQSCSRSFATKAEEYDLIVAEAGLVRIEGYDGSGFIVNDVQVQGAVFCIGDLTTVWRVQSWDEVTPESLSMLHLFKPAPDLVILGCGLHSQMVPATLQTYFKQHNIAFEAIDTANAVSTFNILNQEGRKVAGCLLPAGAN